VDGQLQLNSNDSLERGALGTAFDTPESKRRYARRVFGTIADRYDLITRLLSFGQDQGWKRYLIRLAGVGRTDRMLDLACGTGDLALLATSRGARVIGLDFTPHMIALARRKPASDRVTWVVGDMGQLPIANGAVTIVTIGYGLRNVPDLEAALREAHRVLAARGTLASLDFDRPDSALLRSAYLAYLTVVGATLGWVLHRNPDTYRYIAASIRRYPGARVVSGMLRTAGFERVDHVPVLGGLMAIHVARKA
jgi:demethylmenaquinone methyltransferase/2-methoxy-6-polyprenyl-1,4-benzoquinol methylase